MTTYPALSVMALDILSIPAMEAEPERLFSSAKATMTDKINQMKAETLEALESLKSWLGGHSTACLDSCRRQLDSNSKAHLILSVYCNSFNIALLLLQYIVAVQE